MIAIRRFSRRLIPGSWRWRAYPLEYLQPADRMGQVVERERARVDRHGGRLALVVLTPKTRAFGAAGLAHLDTLLQRRLRFTDEAGLLDRRHVGVVLPDTPLSGARKLAQDIRGLCRLEPDSFDCQVHIYPETPRPSREDDHTKGEGDDLSTPAGRTLQTIFVHPLPAWKRGLDVIGALLGLALLSPILLLAAVLVKLSSPGPVLFSQWRDGLGGRPFKIYKFRSMSADAERRQSELRACSEQDGPAFKMTNDPRVTTVGRWLRKTSIDELPQLWNVLIGDMSLVGPRPLPCGESAECENWQRRRLDVTPGLTCIWQVEARSQAVFSEWMRMDRRYAQNRTLLTDLRILAATVPAVLFRRGAV